MSEAKDRVVIDDWLRKSNWVLTDHEGEKRNVDFESGASTNSAISPSLFLLENNNLLE